jgi:hypothetical protein
MDITHFATHYPEILRKIAQHAYGARGPYTVAALARAFGTECGVIRHLEYHVENLRKIDAIPYRIYRYVYRRRQDGYYVDRCDVSFRRNRAGIYISYGVTEDGVVCVGRADSTIHHAVGTRYSVLSQKTEDAYLDWLVDNVTLATALHIMRKHGSFCARAIGCECGRCTGALTERRRKQFPGRRDPAGGAENAAAGSQSRAATARLPPRPGPPGHFATAGGDNEPAQ